MALALCVSSNPGARGASDPGRPKESSLNLDEWRQRNQDFVAALKETDPKTRVDQFENLLRKYPGWSAGSGVQQLLATALLQAKTPDLGRVESLLDEASRGAAVSCYRLESILRTYVEHPELPMAGARVVMQRADAKLARDRREANGVTPKSRRLETEAAVEKCAQTLKALQGNLLWARGDAAGAVPILREAESLGVRLGIDLFPMDERGRPGEPFPTGRLDELRLSLAMACERTGDSESARQELSRLLGSQLGESEREQARVLRTRLGVELPPSVEVRAPLTRAPDLTLADLSGRKHRLRDYRGRVVVLNFWSTT
jgi:hypothetical protein